MKKLIQYTKRKFHRSHSQPVEHRKSNGGTKHNSTAQAAQTSTSSTNIYDANVHASNSTFHLRHPGAFESYDGDSEFELPTSTCYSEDRNFEHRALDKHMMQTIIDVKYDSKCRHKVTVFADVNFQRECLDAHNQLRETFGCNHLVWSQELADLAHTWAEKLADRGRILYPELPGICENIHLAMTKNENHLPSGHELVELWAKEADLFDFAQPKWQFNCQHFTQMVWRESEELGVARCWQSAKGIVAVVAFYRPGGNSNAPGDFRLNVPSKVSPLGSHAEVTLTAARGLDIHVPRHLSATEQCNQPAQTANAMQSPVYSKRLNALA